MKIYSANFESDVENYKWEKSWQKISNRLGASGLWSDYKKTVDIALSVGQKKIKEAYKIYWQDYDNLDYNQTRNYNSGLIEKIDSRLVKNNDKGEMYANTDILWHMIMPAKIKKMYFGRDLNETKLESVKSILGSNEDGRVSSRTNYDVSFSYNAEEKKAFYNEEYRNSGNGHYYLALDCTHAVFYEDD